MQQINDRVIKIAPSILSADFARLGNAVKEAAESGADYIHIDVMDGHFVPQITIGAGMVKALRKWTNLPFDVHLMIESPERQIPLFVEAGANIITVHSETCPHAYRVIQMIKDAGVRAGVSVNPATSIHALDEILPEVDLVLLMTVNPGYGGQKFIETTLDKISRMRAEMNRRGVKAELEVDGGINLETAPRVVKAGAGVLVAGAAVFSSGKSVKESITDLRTSLRSLAV
ncbi:MAG TPA: ribulose-phosphate 3-epimerase [Dehalococcoidales bacterium]|nr:ribulose-phosphate 3-epimerase [Dehalococcoidales bacterium]